jgi:hypothetical protein
MSDMLKQIKTLLRETLKVFIFEALDNGFLTALAIAAAIGLIILNTQ